MPRSSPSTDGELLEIELEAPSSAPSSDGPAPRTFRLRPVFLVVLGSALIFGLLVVPGAGDSPLTLVPVGTLPEPVVATTTPALPALNQATLVDDTFELFPVVGLEGITRVAGPAVFEGQVWLIVSSPDSIRVLKSEDGADWTQVSEITGESGMMTIQDLESFGGSLVALGTISDQTGPAAAYGYPDQVVIWRSSDGARWAERVIVPYDGENWHQELTLVTDGRSILIGASELAAGGQPLEEAIPPGLSAAVIEGRLDLVLNPPVGTISVMAPPGIEVYRSEASVSPPTDVRNILYLSEDSRQWNEVEIDPGLITGSGLLTRPGRGFLARDASGEMYSTIDGLGWGRNRTVPPATYSRWGEWLVGVQAQPWSDRLMIGAGTEYAGIELPDDLPIWSDSGQVTGGPGGLVSVVPIYLGPAPTVSITSDAQQFTLTPDRFSIATEAGTAFVIYARLTGSYDPVTDEVTIDLSDRGDQVVVDLDDLQVLRGRSAGMWETKVFASRDALSWAQSDLILDSPYVEILGPLPEGFLIAVWTGVDDIELYRTGPLPEGMVG